MGYRCLSSIFTCGRSMRIAASLCLAIGLACRVTSAGAQSTLPIGPQADAGNSMTGGDMSHMAGHMFLTSLRPMQPGDQQKADAVVAEAKQAMEPYRDYHKALADGYRIFLPNVPQAIYHFSRRDYAIAARWQFNPAFPTSLLYTKTPDGGYKLVGVMYTDRVDATEDELNDRIPLSIARWHQHINFCKAPRPAENSLSRTRCQVRPARFHHHGSGMRRRGRNLLSARLRMDGARLPLRKRSEANLVD